MAKPRGRGWRGMEEVTDLTGCLEEMGCGGRRGRKLGIWECAVGSHIVYFNLQAFSVFQSWLMAVGEGAWHRCGVFLKALWRKNKTSS